MKQGQLYFILLFLKRVTCLPTTKVFRIKQTVSLIIQTVKIDVVFSDRYRRSLVPVISGSDPTDRADICICRSIHSANSAETNRFFGKGILTMYFRYGTQVQTKIIESFVEKASNFHSTIKFTAEMSETEIMFLDTKVCKGVRFDEESILDVQTHFYLQLTETFQYTDFYSCNPPGVKKGFIKGEVLRLLRTNSSQITSERSIINFQNRLLERGSCLYFKKVRQETSTFCYTIPPCFTQPEENTYGEMAPYTKPVTTKRNLQRASPHILSHGKSLKDLLVRAKL